MKSTKYPCDLHCHTTRSDGNDTPAELIAHAAEAGMSVIGLVDHDIVPPDILTVEGEGTVSLEDYASRLGITVVPGYEFSCDTRVDDVHICGYLMDWSHAGIAAEMAACEQSKMDAYRELCQRLAEAGLPVDWEQDILRYTVSGGQTAFRRPEEVQRKHIFEAIAARGYVESWNAAKLLVRDNPDLNVSRRKIAPADAIRLIHQGGGIAILAHPFLIDEIVEPSPGTRITRDEYIAGLIRAGLDGIEASYTYDKTTYQGSLSPEQIEAEIRSRYQGRLRCFSGGSDYHADQKKGVRNPRRIGERGITLAEYEEGFRTPWACQFRQTGQDQPCEPPHQ